MHGYCDRSRVRGSLSRASWYEALAKGLRASRAAGFERGRDATDPSRAQVELSIVRVQCTIDASVHSFEMLFSTLHFSCVSFSIIESMLRLQF